MFISILTDSFNYIRDALPSCIKKLYDSFFAHNPIVFIIIVASIIVLLKVVHSACKRNKRHKVMEQKGEEGEQRVRKELGKLNRNYHVYNDVLLPTKYGTTQIDHVIISKYGVFVVETKNYKGLICGREFGKNWTQYIGKQYRKEINNPMAQNRSHIRALSELFADKTPFFSIVAFVGNCKISVGVKSKTTKAVKINGVLCAIRKHKRIIISEKNVRRYCSLIEKNNISGNYARKKHVEYVKGITKKRG